MRCVYCQNWDLLPAGGRGFTAEPEILAEIIMERARRGSINVNWVGGDPTPNLHTVLGTLNLIEVNLPQVWNSNMYCSEETMALLEGAVDVYLADMRYGNDECAVRLSSAPGYRETVTRNFLHANTTADLLVRHLVLPGHLECCTKPIIEWCAVNLGKDVRFNLMFQYRPENHAREHNDINRNLSLKERKRAREIASDAGLVNVIR
jgi:putative pyruvate formate lyase activating enzyme